MASTQKTSSPPASPDPEIRPNAVRTQWSARDQLRILEAADACPPGELGAVLRREGELAALEPKRRAEPSPESCAQAAELARLQRENQRLQAKFTQAEVIIDVQKKLATLLGITLPEPPSDEPA
jgi:transposase